VDLVVAFPFALMVQALCLYPLPFKHGERRVAFLFGAFASLAWMALVSFATPFLWISPVIPWALVMATISISSLLMHRLQNAEFTNERVQAAERRKATDARKAEASVMPNGATGVDGSLLPAVSAAPVPGM
jgi:hypothetical protein